MGKKVIDVADKPTLDNILGLSEHALDMLDSPEKKPVRYGIKIQKNNSDPSTRITYTFDAKGMTPVTPVSNGISFGSDKEKSWESAWFVRDTIPVLLTYDGEEIPLDPRNYAIEKVTRKSVAISSKSLNGNIMTKLPLVYVSINDDDAYHYITISNVKYDETYIPIAHINSNGDVVEKSYFGTYKGFFYNDKIRSISDVIPTTDITKIVNDDYFKNNGSGYCSATWGQRFMITCLLAIMCKNDNMQQIYGYGNDTVESVGQGNTVGRFYAYLSSSYYMKALHIESFWGNGYEYTDGVFLGTTGNVLSYYTSWGGGGIREFADLSNLQNYPNYVKTTLPTTVSRGTHITNKYTTSISTDPSHIVDTIVEPGVGRLPISYGGSQTTYVCDGFRFVGSKKADNLFYAFIGGGNSSYYRGPWSVMFEDCTNTTQSTAEYNRTCRLAYLK